MRLNMATRRWHADVDESWLELMSPAINRADYLAQLVRTYGFVAPFESACKYTPELDRHIELATYSRAGLVARDILELGVTPQQVASIETCAITPFKDVPEALGWLYVVERATLLQDGVRRHLVAHLPEVASACSYLSAFDGRVGDHWIRFGVALDRFAAKSDLANEVIDAAHHGFQRVLDWYRNPRLGIARRIG
jgi:heme oxygenase (biliverdin-IX-beta and delta-forming)